jgi:predicted Zn-dependent protease
MNELASWALNTAALRGASYADVRLGDDRSRALSSKNGKVGSASVAESHGFGVRVIADGAWGFAASDDLSRAGVEATAARAVEIANSRTSSGIISPSPDDSRGCAIFGSFARRSTVPGSAHRSTHAFAKERGEGGVPGLPSFFLIAPSCCS